MDSNRRILKNKKEQKLKQLKRYTQKKLAQTDWIIIKIKEMELYRMFNMLGEKSVEYLKRIKGETPVVNVPAMIQSYGDILSQRLKIRIEHDELEKKILEAETVEQLQKIKIGG